MEAKYEELQAMGAEVLAISADSHWSHAAYAQRLKLSFPLLSDYMKDVARAYVGFYDEVAWYRGVPRRATFVIAPSGVVTWKWVGDTPSAIADPEEVVLAVQEIFHG